jgi:c(7)-type cytochrome triheme protein
MGTCMGCHTVVGTAKPEVQKLAAFYNKKEPVPWIRIHKLPEYVHFPHMRHVNAGVSCQTCHGNVQNMAQVSQQNTLNMGWCVNCHVGRSNPPFKARYDCATCHY